MAFQKHQGFFTFLQDTATNDPYLAYRAPAENYILDERVSDAREDDYLDFDAFGKNDPFTVQSWMEHARQYAKDRIAIRPRSPQPSHTFTAINRDNWLNGLEGASSVVRLETLGGLCSLGRSAGMEEAEVLELIEEMNKARELNQSMEEDREAALQKWLNAVNRSRDERPTFVAPYGEVEAILNSPDWAERLRDVFGLGHISPRNGGSVDVVLMKYSLEKVRLSHQKKFNNPARNTAWAATPTILDDVPSAAPSACFFPGPKSASPNGYGFTVNLDESGAAAGSKQEFLHAKTDYELKDIYRLGKIQKPVDEQQIESARKRHRDALGGHLIYNGDV